MSAVPKTRFEIQMGPLRETAACLPFKVEIDAAGESNKVFACRKCKVIYRVKEASAKRFRKAIGNYRKGDTTAYFVCGHMGRIIG